MLHLPILRAGKAYRSIETTTLRHIRTGEPVAQVSQANSGLIARDLLQAAEHRRALQRVPVRELLDICKRAATLFAEGELPVDPVDGTMQSADDYVKQLSATTGMPEALCRGNMAKIRFVLDEMETVLGGLTRGLALDVLDSGWARQDGRSVSYIAEGDTLGAVLPSNSPGVHSLWLPAIPLKMPLALKPGRQEPWTPFRVLQALLAAGCPAEALGFYPADHGAAGTLLMRTDRSMIFGDERSVRGWVGDPRVQIHGPGWSKVLLGEDGAEAWESHLDTIVASVAENGGRSCLNASGIWTPRHGRAIAEAAAERLAAVEARALDDPEARVAAFSDPRVAHAMNDMIERGLAAGGAEDVTARHRAGGRLVEKHGCTWLLPTLVWCESHDHPLARAEYLFPFAAVVENPLDTTLDRIGTTLVATGITEDPAYVASLMAARNIDRLNLGSIPTSRVSWDQPHEGNLFEHLYRQRAFQSPEAGPTASHTATATA